MTYVVEQYGSRWIAHHKGDDCLADEHNAHHAESDHPVAALRALVKKEA